MNSSQEDPTQPGRLFYKFMSSKHLEGFLSGRSVKFGTLDEYRGFFDPQSRIESIYGASRQVPDSPIDPIVAEFERQEGISKEAVLREGIEDLWEGFDAYAVETSVAQSGVTLRNSSSVGLLPNLAVFCGSRSLTPSVVEKMRTDSKKVGAEPYDVCVPISNYFAFFHLLTSALRFRFSKYTNLDFTVARIRYLEKGRVTTWFETPKPNPFEKRPRFAQQDEVRYLLHSPIPDFEIGAPLSLGVDINRYCWDPIYLPELFPSKQAA